MQNQRSQREHKDNAAENCHALSGRSQSLGRCQFRQDKGF